MKATMSGNLILLVGLVSLALAVEADARQMENLGRGVIAIHQGGGKGLRIFTTTIPADRRFYTLMHDPTYRLSVAWQNVAYNQPTQPGFCFGEGMAAPPRSSAVRPWSFGADRHPVPHWLDCHCTRDGFPE